MSTERERIARAGADFFQNGDFDNWLSPTGRRFEDLGNGWQVGYDMMLTIIEGATSESELNRGATLDADQAFIESQLQGGTKAQGVRAAIKAYLKSEQVAKDK